MNKIIINDYNIIQDKITGHDSREKLIQVNIPITHNNLISTCFIGCLSSILINEFYNSLFDYEHVEVKMDRYVLLNLPDKIH